MFQPSRNICRRRLGGGVVMWCSILAVCLLAPGCGREDDHANATVEDAWAALRVRNDTKARAVFERVGAENGEDALNARFGQLMLDSVMTGANYDATVQGLRKLAAEHAGHPLAPWADLTAVRMTHVGERSDVKIDRDAIMNEYRRLMAAYPDTPIADEAMVYLQSLRIQAVDEAELREAVGEIEAYLRQRPGAKFQTSLHGLAANALRRLGDYRAALEHQIASIQTREIDPTNPKLNLAGDYFSVAVQAQFDVGDFATARKYYGLLMHEYPNEQRVFMAKQLIKEMDQTEARLRAEMAAGGGQ